MKILQRILSAIGVILFLLVAFIVFSFFNPSVSQNIGQFLNEHQIGTSSQDDISGNDTEVQSSSVSDNEPVTTMQTDAAMQTEAVGANTSATNVATDATANTDGLAVAPDSTTYVAPSENDLNIPENVSEKSGFVPVQDTGSELSDNDAETLQNQYDYGNTGDDLTFDASIYPYYAMLDTDLQSLYRQIYANINDFQSVFIPVIQTSPSGIKNAFTAVSNDHPELFWLNTEYSYQYMSDGSAALIQLSFNETADDFEVAKNNFDSEIQSLIADAQTKSTDYEKEIAAHDALVAHVLYNVNAAMNQSAYSAVVYGETVCAGYAKAFQYMMQQLGVPCYYCTGFAGENHAWNIIKLDDGYYNVDTTWDDTDPSTYLYFNCSDEDFSSDHMRTDLAVNLPSCDGEQYRRLLVDSTTDAAATGKSLTDIGVSENDVLTTIDAYYQNCLLSLQNSSDNPVTFSNVIKDESLLQEINAAYNNGDYKEAYGNQIVSDKEASTMNLSISVEQLQDGYYLLAHTFTFH